MQRVQPVGSPDEPPDGHEEQQRPENEERPAEAGVSHRRNRGRQPHQVGHLRGQTVDALLEPDDREDDVGEGGHLFDVDHLGDGQVDLDPSLGAQRRSHQLREKVEREEGEKGRTLTGWTSRYILCFSGSGGEIPSNAVL